MASRIHPRAGPSRLALALGTALALITLLLYWPVRGFEFIDLDDPAYVVENYVVQHGLTVEGVRWAFTTGHASNWHPLTWLSHMLDCQLFGLNAGAHHLTNALLHTANATLLFLALLRMTGSRWRCAIVAALFAWHPLHVESVAWVSERKDVLCAFFGFLTLTAYAEYARQRRRRWHAAALFFFALGLLSKPMLVTLPFVLLLLDFWPLNRLAAENGPAVPVEAGGTGSGAPSAARCWLKLALEKWPFLALSAASSVVTFLVQRREAVVPVELLPLFPRVCNALVSYICYLWKMLWPVDLAVFYPFDTQLPWWMWFGAGAVLIAVTAFVASQSKRRPWLAMGWFWHLGMLVPVIGLVQVGRQAMADRYTYLPLVGIFVAIVWSVADWLAPKRRALPVLGWSAGAVLAACLGLTAAQLRHWRSSIELFEHTRRVTPDNANIRFLLGLAHVKKGDLTNAARHYTAALRLRPRHAETLYNLGNVFQLAGRPEDAARCYVEAIQLKPDYDRAHGNLGIVLAALHRPDEAFNHMRRAAELAPRDPDILYNFGLALMERGRALEAVPRLEAAARIRPGWSEPLETLAWLLATHPDPSVRNGPRARQLAEQACALTGHAAAVPMDSLAAACAEIGRFEEAVRLAERALALARNQGQAELAAEIESRLRLYRNRQPYREVPPGTPPPK